MTGNVQLPYIELGTSLSDPHRGGEMFAEAIEPVFDMYYDRSRTADLNADLKSSVIGPAILTQVTMGGVDLNYQRSKSRIARSGLDLIMLQVITRGGDRRSTEGGEVETTRTGDICVVDMTRQVETWTDDCENLSLTLPRELLAPSESHIDGLHGRVLRRETATSAILFSHIASLWCQLARLTPSEGETLGRATVDLTAQLLLPALGETEGTFLSAQIQNIKRYVEANLEHMDLGPDILCRVFAMSRAKLYRLFAPLGGVADYVRNRRLQRVYSALGVPGERHKTIAEIAYGWGFNDLSAFTRAFKARFNMTPGEVRSLASGEHSIRARDEARDLADLRAWLYSQ